MSKQSLAQTRVKRAQPILERIMKATGALDGAIIEGRVWPHPRWSWAQREKFDRTKLEGLRVVVAAAPQVLDQIARDLAALAAIIGAPGAPPYREQRSPEATTEALDWLRRQLDGLGKDGA
jgi:hypothetical protein